MVCGQATAHCESAAMPETKLEARLGARCARLGARCARSMDWVWG